MALDLKALRNCFKNFLIKELLPLWTTRFRKEDKMMKMAEESDKENYR